MEELHKPRKQIERQDSPQWARLRCWWGSPAFCSVWAAAAAACVSTRPVPKGQSLLGTRGAKPMQRWRETYIRKPWSSNRCKCNQKIWNLIQGWNPDVLLVFHGREACCGRRTLAQGHRGIVELAGLFVGQGSQARTVSIVSLQT